MKLFNWVPKISLNNLLIHIEKRVRFVLATVGLAFVMIVSTFFFFDKAWIFIPIIILVTYFVTYASILEGIERSEWMMLFLIPVVFSVAFYLFYFLFPVRWLTRVPFIALYGVAIYAILLTSNIFNVGVEKSIQLYRAAFSVNYLFHTIIFFLATNILFSARENFLINALAVGVAAFPMSLQLYWTIKLNLDIDKSLYFYSMFTSIILAQIALVLSFVPFRASILALLVTASYYSITGLVTAAIDSRLFKKTVREYVVVLAIVIAIGLLTLNW